MTTGSQGSLTAAELRRNDHRERSPDGARSVAVERDDTIYDPRSLPVTTDGPVLRRHAPVPVWHAQGTAPATPTEPADELEQLKGRVERLESAVQELLQWQHDLRKGIR